MLRRSTTTRTASAVLAAGLGLALLAAGSPASAAPARPTSSASAASSAGASALKMSGPYAAAADASLLTLDVPSLSPALLPQTNIDLARSSAVAESDQDVDADKAGAQRTGASAGTTGFGSTATHVLGAELAIQTNEASAPESEANEDIAIPLDLSPLLDVPVIRTTALANWVSDTECVTATTPLSQADQSLADLTLLGIAPDQSVLDLDTDDADGAADTEAQTFLASIPGPNDPRAVQARVITDITSANVLNNLGGSGSAIEVDAVQTPNYIVSASGLPGGASVTGDDPVVNVTIAGQPLITLDSSHKTQDATITDLLLGNLLDISSPGLLTDLVNDLGLPLGDLTHPIDQALTTALGELQPIVRLSIPLSKTASADGTHASVQAALLRVEVLLPSALGAAAPLRDGLNQILDALGADIDGPLLSLDLGPVGASVVAPAGGITCGEPLNPLRELNKHASALEVAPGGTFEYNIAVPNRGPCAVKGVKVTDVVTGPAGFQIVDTEPDGTIDGGKVTFDLGDLAVNQTKNITLTIKVPADAKNGATFDDVVTATGTCDGRPISKDDRVDDTPVVRTDFTGPCNVTFSNKDASHIQVFPGETFSYYVHAFNAGAEPCTNVTISDTLDSRVSFVSCNKSCVNDPADKVTWKVDTIPAGSSVILSVVVKVDDDAKGVLENAAIITPSNGSPTTVKTRGPVIGPDSIPKDPSPASRHPLPKTGGVLPTGLGALLGAGALALFALRRRATA
jgi:uncharacterized repeat protein (TIGR01451 family)